MAANVINISPIVTTTKIRDYNIATKELNTIIDEIDISYEDKILLESIIDNLETTAYSKFKEDKAIKIPYIANFRPNLTKRRFKERSKELREIRRNNTKEEYKRKVGEIYKEIKKQVESERISNNIHKYNIKGLQKEYESKAILYGVNFARIWFRLISSPKVVMFDRDVEYQYKLLYEKEQFKH